MKLVLTIFLPVTVFLYSGCYSVSSLKEKPKELVETNLSSEEISEDYFDEGYNNVETDGGYELANTDSLEEEELGFFEYLITEIISGFSDISNNEDTMIMIFNGDNIVYIVNSENSTSTSENSSTDQNHSATRNNGDRNYNSRK